MLSEGIKLKILVDIRQKANKNREHQAYVLLKDYQLPNTIDFEREFQKWLESQPEIISVKRIGKGTFDCLVNLEL